MTVAVVMLSLAPILWESGIGADADSGANRPRNDQVDIHALILVPVFFAMIKHRALRQGSLGPET
jgi:Cu(I)/Ag(I) efflux system membrane protein CusA/SilA